MALPILNNESQKLSEVIELSTEINMDGFTGLGALLEAQAKTLQSIEKILSRQYQSYLDAERERRENEKEARNKIPPTGPNTDTPPSAGDDAGGFSLLASLFTSIKKSIEFVIKKLKSAFKPIISVFESVITKLKSAFKPIISVFESVITKLKSVFKPIISVFESVITKLKSVFKPIISVFESVITKLKSVFKPIFSSFETVFPVFKNIVKLFARFNLFGLIIFGLIDFIRGFIDKFKAADSLGEGILEGLWGGFTNIIRGFVAIPLDLLKDLLSWLAEKLGFSEVAKLLDSFSFVDLYDKATEWYYNTETNTWFGGVFDDLPEKMKALYTDLKTKLKSFVKDYIYDGSGDKIKLFGQELPNMTDIIQFGTEMKTKLESFIKDYIYDGSGDRTKIFGQELPTFDDIGNWATSIKEKIGNFIKDNIYDGSGDKIKLFGQELPNMTDIANFGTEIKTKLESFIKDYIYDGSGDKIKLFGQELPNMTDIANFGTEIKTKLTEFVKNNIYDGSGDRIKVFGQELPNMTDISNFGTEMKTKLESFIKDYIYDPETGSILGFKIPSIADLKLPEFPDIGEKISGFVDELGKFFADLIPSKDDLLGMAFAAITGDDGKINGVTETALALTIPGYSEKEIETIAQAYLTREAGGPIQAGQPYLVGEAGPELIIPNASGKVIPNDALQTTLARNGEAIYQGSNEVSNLMNGGTTIIAPTNVSDNSVKNTTTTTMSGSSNVRTTDDSVRAFNSNPYM
jgi:hypothetical protein